MPCTILPCRAQSYGLTINADKMKVLTSDGFPVNTQLDGVQIELVRGFKYLGSLVQEIKVITTMVIRPLDYHI